jgi:hypothetical protein
MFFSWDDPKTLANLIVGFLLTAFGLIPLLNHFGVIGWNLPEFMIGLMGNFALYLIAGIGIWLIIDGFLEDETIQKITLLIGLLVLIFGIIPLLNQFGVISITIPFLNLLVFQALFVVEGILLIIAAFVVF